MKRPTADELIRLAKRLVTARAHLPDGHAGEYSIESRTIQKDFIVNFRDAMFTGLPKCDYPDPVTIRELKGPEGTWMSDRPCELVQMHRELAVHARGDVLIGGLGLGLIARMAARRRSVSSITVVERQREVIALVKPYLDSKVKVIQADIFDYARSPEAARHDVALLDVWQGTGEWVWQTEVVPLRRALYGKIRRVHCWHEDVMINQVASMLYRVAAMPIEDGLRQYNVCHYYAFRRGIVDLGVRTESGVPGCGGTSLESSMKLSEVEMENRKDEELRRCMALFFQTVGDPCWEGYFGRYWDEAWALRPKETADSTAA